MNTGTAKLQVRLTDRTWKGVGPDVVKLLVIENIMLQPSVDVYILPVSFVNYRVERRKHGRSEFITMPSEQYSLELTNTTVGRLDSERSRVTGLVVGYTEVVDISILSCRLVSMPISIPCVQRRRQSSVVSVALTTCQTCCTHHLPPNQVSEFMWYLLTVSVSKGLTLL